MTEWRTSPLNDGFGAEVEGFDPRTDLDGRGRTRLLELFDDRSVLLFRDLDLDRGGLEDLVRLLSGETELDDGYASDSPGSGRKAKVRDIFVSNKEAGAGVPFGRLPFHHDMMWAEQPYHVTSLHALEVAPPVAPTWFVSGTAAWSTLPDDLREQVEGRYAEHVNDASEMRGDGADLLHITYERPQTVARPVAWEHPRTARTVLYVSQMMTKAILGLEPDASEDLLGRLFEHLYRPEAIWAHVWSAGDLIVWDNFAVQHARPDVKEDGPVRTLRKVSSRAGSEGRAGRATFSRAR
jgi:alpha-ketoglutarate-dependent taurine dioxygenase